MCSHRSAECTRSRSGRLGRTRGPTAWCSAVCSPVTTLLSTTVLDTRPPDLLVAGQIRGKKDLFSEQVTLRFTPSEYAQVLAEAQKSELSLAEHLRARIVDHQLTFITKVVPDKKYRNELSRAGISLNQIAAALNSIPLEQLSASGLLEHIVKAKWDQTAIRSELEKFNNPAQ